MDPKERLRPTMSRRQSPSSSSKPKIRVVHVFAPEVVETDAANFREVVQRLTGKPAGKGVTTVMKKKRKRRRRRSRRSSCTTANMAGDHAVADEPGDGEAGKEEEEVGGEYEREEGVKKEKEEEGEEGEERESWMEMEMEMEMERSSGGSNYLCRGFGEIDGFLQELSDLPLPD